MRARYRRLPRVYNGRRYKVRLTDLMLDLVEGATCGPRPREVCGVGTYLAPAKVNHDQ